MSRCATALALALVGAVAGCGGGDEPGPAPAPRALVPAESGFADHAFPVYPGKAFAFGGLVVRSGPGAPVTLLEARPARPTGPLELVGAYAAGAGRKFASFQSTMDWPEPEQTRIEPLRGVRVGPDPAGVQIILRLRTAADAADPISFRAIDVRTRAADGAEAVTRVPITVRLCPGGPTERELLAEPCKLLGQAGPATDAGG